ncbi:hypothetical protein GCM10007387_57000 [Pseudoduganella albidiflava]|uniref:Uncharacterized protein n=1 Tax=Pseudoduganella albidiflava TaxID=321983 RepID=A0AA87Y0B8_9BURK|nr:hypothetical protein GCM10007387_57000 [Pseudoduganella albidiflava]
MQVALRGRLRLRMPPDVERLPCKKNKRCTVNLANSSVPAGCHCPASCRQIPPVCPVCTRPRIRRRGLAGLYTGLDAQAITAAGAPWPPACRWPASPAENVDCIMLADGMRLAGDMAGAVPPTPLKDIAPPAWRAMSP